MRNIYLSIITARVRSTREGNVFSLFVRGGEGAGLWSQVLSGGVLPSPATGPVSGTARERGYPQSGRVPPPPPQPEQESEYCYAAGGKPLAVTQGGAFLFDMLIHFSTQ